MGGSGANGLSTSLQAGNRLTPEDRKQYENTG